MNTVVYLFIYLFLINLNLLKSLKQSGLSLLQPFVGSEICKETLKICSRVLNDFSYDLHKGYLHTMEKCPSALSSVLQVKLVAGATTIFVATQSG